ncbi:MAG: RecX family transcriptional regulator [Bacteroidetes bacterium]|nr:RecX family transcriptional regulator [Bacteroidota bacterium]
MNQSLTPNQALEKIKGYCAYQERCHSDVINKLYSFGLNKNEVAEITAQLVSENYLNEQRFAIMFAGGKFRMKHWGKNKIIYELKQKQVSDYCIKKALTTIDFNEYETTFQKLAAQKLKTLKSEKNIFIKKKKLQTYLLSKGYESKEIYNLLNQLNK